MCKESWRCCICICCFMYCIAITGIVLWLIFYHSHPHPDPVFAEISLTGACFDGVCTIRTKSECTDGVYIGDSTTCDNLPGSCCVNSVCEEITYSACQEKRGSWIFDKKCTDALCSNPPQIGICCVKKEGRCYEGYTESVCQLVDGVFSTAMNCTDSFCPPVGACCATDTDVCESTTRTACKGTWSFDSCKPFSCMKNPPQKVGGCCMPDKRTCMVIGEDSCRLNGGIYFGEETTCENCKGSCCNHNLGSCEDVTLEETERCNGYSYEVFTYNKTCLESCQFGACCRNRMCYQTNPVSCKKDLGTYVGGACTAYTCVSKERAVQCCFVQSMKYKCSVISKKMCMSIGGIVVGRYSSCTEDSCNMLNIFKCQFFDCEN